MRVLIISSEELYEHNIMPSIFEIAQAKALKKLGIEVHLMAINVPYTVLGLLKNIIGRALLIPQKENPKYNNPLTTNIVLFLKALFEYLGLKKSKPIFFSIDGIDIITNNITPLIANYSIEGIIKKWNNSAFSAYYTYEKKIGRPDLIHAHSRFLYAGTFAVKIKRRKNIPYVLTEHSSYYANVAMSTMVISLAKEMIKESSKYLVVSESLGAHVIKRLEDDSIKYTVVPNLIDTSFENVQPIYKNKETEFTFISVASLGEIKGHFFLLKAFAKKFRGNNNYKLKLIGEGELKEDLINLCKEEKIDHQVSFLGKLDKDIVIQELDKSNAFILTSRYETFGVAIIEAMSRGLPILATKCGGPDNIINNENGILVEPKNIDSITLGLEFIITNYDKYNRNAIREFTVLNYGSLPIANRIKSIYDNVLKEKI